MAEPPAEPQEFETHEEILAWARRHYGRRWLRSLSPAQVEALRAFKSDVDVVINRYLRQGAIPVLPPISTIRRWVADANATLLVKPLDHAVVAYRGLNLERDMGIADPASSIGSVFHDRGLVSTTVWRPVARRFGADLMAIVIPRGTPAAWLEDISPRNEFEVLLQSDGLFQISAYEEQHGERILRVTSMGREA